MKDRIDLHIPAKAEYLHLVRLTLFGIASDIGYSFEQIEDMKVAIGEACNNVILHAYRDKEPGILKIQFGIDDQGLNIHIKDEGISFNYESMINKSTNVHEDSLSDISIGGLGIYMMQALMDEVEVRNYHGTEIILTKRLRGS